MDPSTDLPKSYNPEEAERKWYDIWEKRGYFRPEVNPDGEPYCIVIPPPNVTGSLHMGHALNATIHDILIRWKRMKGYRTLWLPGTDHAGIATQNVVERKLEAEGTTRHALGRGAFVHRVWEWKKEYGSRITNQLRVIGSSCDWSRERFTMDDGLSSAVREVFVRLHGEGLIYRAERLINWCPRCKTALSDLEVEHEDMDGTLTYIKYPMVNRNDGYITVATTRPETMLGDTAVAVNPTDERYAPMIGKMIALPLTGRTIPVVADKEVDPSFGTGAVKVTPAHDFNDEAIASRQSPRLPSIAVIGEEGKMTEAAGQAYRGLDRYEARRKVTEALKAEGLIEKIDKHRHSVGQCYRCKTVVEPYGTPQWFVKVAPMAEEAMRVVRTKDIKLLPEGWENNYFAWMENIRDWCITRQIWWGHRVPVWYCRDCGEVIVASVDPDKCTKCASAKIEQDPDVLDTWFSSALWPFSTLGWPDKTEDLRAFYPTSVLITGFDILFFWVARMIMMGTKFMGEVPFRHVYIHALVRDSEGQKMSKSKGNVIDPLIITEKYGADAFRFTFAIFAAQGRDVRFSEERVEGYRHFINKLWNATRFTMMNLDQMKYEALSYEELEAEARRILVEGDPASRWILSRLGQMAREVDRALEEYRFNDAAGAIYQFVWNEFCDWYIEMSKASMNIEAGHTLVYCLDTVLRLLHPFMPFVTEEIWQALPVNNEKDSIMVSRFPVGLPVSEAAEAEMAYVMDAITGIRNIRGELNVPPAEVVEVRLKALTPEAEAAVKRNAHFIERLSRSKNLAVTMDMARPEGSFIAVKPAMEVYVLLSGIDLSAEVDRLTKEMRKAEESMAFIDKKLHNEDFIKRAPEQVVKKEREKFEDLAAKHAKLAENIKRMRELSRNEP